MSHRTLTTEQRKAVFLALVEEQDALGDVPGSRRAVAERFDLTESEVRSIEEEGLQKEWPPL